MRSGFFNKNSYYSIIIIIIIIIIIMRRTGTPTLNQPLEVLES